MRRYQVEIYRGDGAWERFTVALPPGIVDSVEAVQRNLMATLRRALDDDRFRGSAIILTPETGEGREE